MAQTVFVTGADKGLGFCLAGKFAREGYQVFGGHLGDGAALRGLGSATSGRVVPVPQNVTDVASVRRSAELVGAQTPGLDILINCAGVCLDVHDHLAETNVSNGNLEMMMAVNAFGPLRVTQAFLPLIERGGHKVIANISSEAGSIGECWRDVGYGYCMSKAALNMQAQILQRELKPRGVKVLLFHPGWMRTDMGGPTAHITPETAADGIYALTVKPWGLDDPKYMDYTGRVFAW